MPIESEMLEADVFIIGAHQFSGAVMDAWELRELAQDFKNSAPLKVPGTDDALYRFTAGDSHRVPVAPPRCGGVRTARKGRKSY
jgi:hypothetical protein